MKLSLPDRNFVAHGVLFDMDGVLTLNSHFHGQAWQRFAREHLDLELSEHDARIHGGRNSEILFALTGRTPDADTLLACDTAKEGYYRELAGGNLQPTPGLLAYLDWLAEANVPCALVTSADTTNIEFVLAELGLENRFSVRVGANDVRRGKPDPEPYLMAAAGIGVSCAHCLVHEDAPSGVHSALAAGCAVVALTTTVLAPVLQAAGAQRCIPDFTTWLSIVRANESA